MEDVKEAPAVRKSRGRNAAKTKAAPKAPKAPKAPAPKAAKAGKEKKTLDAVSGCLEDSRTFKLTFLAVQAVLFHNLHGIVEH